MNLSGNTVLITGGATGIGFAMAESFLKAGNKVIICGRRKEKLLEAQKKHPDLQIKVCDITNESDRESLFTWVTTNFGGLNVLVNNAGIQRDIDLTKGVKELKKGEDEIKVNLEAPIYLSALFIPYLAERKNAAIINVSSGLGFLPMARMPVYCATKAALHSLCLTLRHQLLKTGIKVFEVIPPMIPDTELNLEGRAKRGHGSLNMKAPTSAEFAAVVMKGLQNDEMEIGYGMTEDFKTASRADLDRRFQQMNSMSFE